MVQVLAHGDGVHMVQDGTGGTGSAVDHAGEGFVLDQRIHLPLALGDGRGDYSVHELVGEVYHLADVADGVGGQEHADQFRGAAGVGDGYAGIHRLVDVVFGHLEERSALDRLGKGKHHLRTLVARQRLGAERPAGANDEVAGHIQAFGLVEDHLEHLYPLVAEPGEGLVPHRVRLLAGE